MFKRLIIALLAVGTICGGAAYAVYATTIGRSMFPQFFIARAALNTARDFTPLLNTVQEIVPQIQGSSLRHEATIGINRIDGAIAENIPPAAMSALPMVSLRNVTLSDRSAFLSDFYVQMAATPIVSASLHLEQDQISVGLPLLFDYNITLDPRRLGSEIDASVLSMVLPQGLIRDDLFYRAYHDFLFAPRDEINIREFLATLARLVPHINYEFYGRTDGVDTYVLTVPQAQANTALTPSLNALGIHIAGNAVFTDDIPIMLSISDNRFYFVSITASMDIDGIQFQPTFNINFPASGQAEIDVFDILQGEIIYTHTQITVHDDSIGFNSSFGYNGVSVNTNGSVNLNTDMWRVEADIRNLSITSYEIDFAINMRYFLTENTAPIIQPAADTRPLTDINAFDLLNMFGRLNDSPLGGILGGVMP